MKYVLDTIRNKCHVSRSKANIEILPYIIVIYEANREQGRKILKWLGISERTFREIIRMRAS